jgi:hypothetical protein
MLKTFANVPASATFDHFRLDTANRTETVRFTDFHIAPDAAPPGPAGVALPGDVNGDGKADVTDLQRLIRVYLGLITPTLRDTLAGDVRPQDGTDGRVYGDGRILSNDLNSSLRKLIGLEAWPE